MKGGGMGRRAVRGALAGKFACPVGRSRRCKGGLK